MFAMLMTIGAFVWADEVEPTKHALIVAVSEYKQKDDISELASDKDALILNQLLLDMGFAKENILSIGKKQATRSGIINKWNELHSRVKPGDVVYIHYSGHGSQVIDLNGDEEDGLDEVWVTYDAVYDTEKELLDPQSVLIDDDIEQLKYSIRKKLGDEGHFLLTTDSCHNATITRSLTDKVRSRSLPNGAKGIVDLDKKEPSKKPEKASASGLAPSISISASMDHQEALEVSVGEEVMGGLTYALKETLGDLSNDVSYAELFHEITVILQRYTPGQTPTMEGSRNHLVFNNTYVHQEKFLSVYKTDKKGNLVIEGGLSLGLNKGAVVGLYPKGTRNSADVEPLALGTVVDVRGPRSMLELVEGQANIDPKKLSEYWGFIKRKSFKANGTSLFLEDIPKDKTKLFMSRVEELPLINIQTDKANADLLVRYEDDAWLLRDLRYPILGSSASKDTSMKSGVLQLSLSQLVPAIQSVSSRQFLLDLMAQYQDDKQFSVEVIDEHNQVMEKNPAGGYALRPLVPFRIRINNNTQKEMFISVISIDDNQNSIQQIVPYDDGVERPISAFRIPSGASYIFPPRESDNAPFEVTEGSEGREMMLFVAHPKKALDFSVLDTQGTRNLVTENTATRSSRGSGDETTIESVLDGATSTRAARIRRKAPAFWGYTQTIFLDVGK